MIAIEKLASDEETTPLVYTTRDELLEAWRLRDERYRTRVPSSAEIEAARALRLAEASFIEVELRAVMWSQAMAWRPPLVLGAVE